jgi:8-oxo-dGTP pyrophosphatase MutT (NUDIX family)
MNSWKTKSSKIVYENPWMIVREDEVVMPNGKDGMYGYVKSKSDAVFVLPVDNEGNTYIIQQEHYTVGRTVWQFVGGRTDNQPPELAAQRELREETGLHAESITILSTSQVAMGMTTFKGSFCLARDITANDDQLDPEEGILEVKKLSFNEIEEKILTGEIANVESIALFFLAKAYLEKEKAL